MICLIKVTPSKSQSQIYFATGKQKLKARIYEFCFLLMFLEFIYLLTAFWRVYHPSEGFISLWGVTSKDPDR
jgi:hypothetical protein